MGIAMQYVRAIERAGAFRDGKIAWLDLGAANVYHVSEEDALYFFNKYGRRPLDDRLRDKAKDLARRSRWTPTPEEPFTFLAELFEETTVDYLAFDVIEGPRTRIFDLNFERLPRRMMGCFDIVGNFGTTEHVVSQYNAFKVVHDALKPGGYVYHQVPSTGFFNHGYFNYNPRFFGELAEANDYEFVDLFYSEPQGHWSLEEYCSPPANLPRAERFRRSVKELGAEVPVMPNGIINVFLRKTTDAPFRLGLDRSNGGYLGSRIERLYGRPGTAGSAVVAGMKSLLRVFGAKWVMRQLGLRRSAGAATPAAKAR